MDEGPQPVAELLLQAVDVLPAQPVALPGDDRHHLVFGRVRSIRNGPDRFVEDGVGLRVGRNQDGVHDATRINDVR